MNKSLFDRIMMRCISIGDEYVPKKTEKLLTVTRLLF